MTKEEQVLDILKEYKSVFIDVPLELYKDKMSPAESSLLKEFFSTYKEQLYNVIDVESHDTMYTGTKEQCVEFIKTHENIWTEFTICRVD